MPIFLVLEKNFIIVVLHTPKTNRLTNTMFLFYQSTWQFKILKSIRIFQNSIKITLKITIKDIALRFIKN